MKNILKSWKTTLVGLIAIAGLSFNIYNNGGLAVTDFLLLITSIGFLLSKDAGQTHSIIMGTEGDTSGGHANPDHEQH